MKRDVDLCRAILLEIEAADPGMYVCRAVAHWREREVGEHLQLLSEAGLVSPKLKDPYQGPRMRLTWKGHEFLDDVREPLRWENVKAVAATAQATSFEALRKIALRLGQQAAMKIRR